MQFIFLLYAAFLGFNFFLLFPRKFRSVYYYILAFPVGLSLWCLLHLFILIIGIPSYPGIVMSLNLIMILVFIVINLGKKKYSGKIFLSLIIFLAVFSFLSIFFLNNNYSYLSNDSWLLIIGGNSLGQTGNIPDLLLAIKGIYSYLLNSPGAYFGFDYPYALFPLLMFSLFSVFFYGLYSGGEKIKIKIDLRFYYSVLASVFLISGYFIFFNQFFNISNSPTAVFSFLAFFGIFMRLKTGNFVWTALLSLMVINLALLRLEGSLFCLIPVIIFLSREEISPKERNIFIVSSLSIPILWILRLSYLLPESLPRKMKVGYKSEILVLLLLLYMVVILYTFISQKRIFWSINSLLPLLVLLILSLGWTFMIFYRGLVIKGIGMMTIKRYGDLIMNVIKDGKWGMTWLGLIILMIAVPFLKKIKNESIFVYYIISFFLLYNIINLYRYGWRRGWGDSGNRILLHIVFIVAFYVFYKIAQAYFPQSESQIEK